MARNQLFKKVPPLKLVLQLLNCFGFRDLNDKKSISKKNFNKFNILEKIIKLLPELNKYYLPCKSKIYLKKLNNKKIMTILRQCIRNYGYRIISKEKYSKGEKFMIYSIKADNPSNYKLISTNLDISKEKYIIINFD